MNLTAAQLEIMLSHFVLNSTGYVAGAWAAGKQMGESACPYLAGDMRYSWFRGYFDAMTEAFIQRLPSERAKSGGERQVAQASEQGEFFATEA